MPTTPMKPTRLPTASFKSFAIALLAVSTLTIAPLRSAEAGTSVRLQKDAQGRILPFKLIDARLNDFIREYSRLTGMPITTGGSLDQDIAGKVTLFIRKPLTPDAFAEVFHRVLGANMYSVVDAPVGNGWIVERARDARDGSLPFYDSAQVPDSARIVTVNHKLKHADAEAVARMMRSFMPANSRIIPASGARLLITDAASNIRKSLRLIARVDTPEAARRYKERGPSFDGPPRACGEKRIEKLVVEKLEISDPGPLGPHAKPAVGGSKK
jgi:type II secretory pathway component GspD/PulD (secretin)